MKSATGETELYPLTAARKARKDEHLERRCLHGHYGGVPRISEGDLARTLTLLDNEAKATV